jgi:hypothetical protein
MEIEQCLAGASMACIRKRKRESISALRAYGCNAPEQKAEEVGAGGEEAVRLEDIVAKSSVIPTYHLLLDVAVDGDDVVGAGVPLLSSSSSVSLARRRQVLRDRINRDSATAEQDLDEVLEMITTTTTTTAEGGRWKQRVASLLLQDGVAPAVLLPSSPAAVDTDEEQEQEQEQEQQEQECEVEAAVATNEDNIASTELVESVTSERAAVAEQEHVAYAATMALDVDVDLMDLFALSGGGDDDDDATVSSVPDSGAEADAMSVSEEIQSLSSNRDSVDNDAKAEEEEEQVTVATAVTEAPVDPPCPFTPFDGLGVLYPTDVADIGINEADFGLDPLPQNLNPWTPGDLLSDNAPQQEQEQGNTPEPPMPVMVMQPEPAPQQLDPVLPEGSDVDVIALYALIEREARQQQQRQQQQQTVRKPRQRRTATKPKFNPLSTSAGAQKLHRQFPQLRAIIPGMDDMVVTCHTFGGDDADPRFPPNYGYTTNFGGHGMPSYTPFYNNNNSSSSTPTWVAPAVGPIQYGHGGPSYGNWYASYSSSSSPYSSSSDVGIPWQPTVAPLSTATAAAANQDDFTFVFEEYHGATQQPRQ